MTATNKKALLKNQNLQILMHVIENNTQVVSQKIQWSIQTKLEVYD
tara:strand:+ start:197 stop:334 length:138 start_codon:yes stop_codon:yes gene_type:complete